MLEPKYLYNHLGCCSPGLIAWKQGKGSGKGRKKVESWAWPGVVLTSRCPLCTAWCRALRPLLSATLRLLSKGARASAHLVARLAAATCNGVCHSLSRAFTSAECASSSPSTFCGGVEDKRLFLQEAIHGNFIEHNYHEKSKLYLVQIPFTIQWLPSIEIFLPQMPLRYPELEGICSFTVYIYNWKLLYVIINVFINYIQCF